MEFDTSRLFGSKCNIHAKVKPMDLSFLISHAFNFRHGAYEPEALEVVLARCYELFVEETTKPEQLRDVLTRSLKAGRSESGLFGLGKLSVEELTKGRSYMNTEVGITGAKIRLRRYGDCLAIQPVNERDETHEKVAGIFDRIIREGRYYMRHFAQRYSFALTPVLKGASGAYVLNVQDELAVMDRYLPDIKWVGSKRLTSDLGLDFTSHQRTGVKVGSYGDAEVFARIVYEREVNDQDWRRGKVQSIAGNELFFGVSAGDRPQIEYLIQMTERDSYDPARSDIDYWREQVLLHDLARMLYAGLYQREFQSIVRNGNEPWIRFRCEPEKATT